MVTTAPAAYQGRVGMPTGPLSAWMHRGGAWEAVEDVRVDRAYTRFDGCVPVPGAYVPETGTPSPFPTGSEL